MTYPYVRTPQRFNGSKITTGTLDTYVYVESMDEDFRIRLKVTYYYEQGDFYTPDDSTYEVELEEILEPVTATQRVLIEAALELTQDDIIEREWEAIKWE